MPKLKKDVSNPMARLLLSVSKINNNFDKAMYYRIKFVSPYIDEYINIPYRKIMKKLGDKWLMIQLIVMIKANRLW